MDLILIANIFLGLCALSVPYISKWLERNMYVPKLEFSFKLAPPYCHKTRWNMGQPVYYFRLRIHNTGRSLARKCEVVLENIWVYKNGTPKKIRNFSPVNLIGVVGQRTQFFDINPQRSFFYDIGHISSLQYQMEREINNLINIYECHRNDLQFILDLLHVYYAQPNCLCPGRYILEIGAYSENATYRKAFFEISWSGVWKENEIEMFREINIKQIDDESFPGYIDPIYDIIARDRNEN